MRVEPAPILVVTLVSLVGPLREVEVVPVAGGLIRLHAAAADLRRQQAAECQRMVRMISASNRYLAWRAKSRFAGSSSTSAGLAIELCR